MDVSMTSGQGWDPDDEQRQAIALARDPGVGALLVVGGPGTGKTRTLVEVVAGAALPLDRVLVVGVTRPLAQRLRNQVMRRLGGAQLAPRVMTAHALSHALVGDSPEPQAPDWTLLTAPEQEFRLRELLQRHDTSRWPDDLRRAATTRSFAAEVRSAVTRVRQLGLDPTDVAELGRAADRPEWAVLGGFMDEYLQVVDATFEIDYAELVHRARLRLLDEDYLARVVERTPLVLVDTYDELDPSQVQLLADLVRGGSKLVAFADPTTSVYSFRGAGTGGLSSFNQVFARASPQRVDLGLDHQRASLVRGALAQVAERLPRNDHVRVPELDPASERPGQVMVRVYDSAGAEVEHIVETIRQARLSQRLRWHDMAVITRSRHGGLAAIARALTTAGVPVQMPGVDIALREAAAVRPLLVALRVLLARLEGRRASAEEATALLRSPMGGLDSMQTRRLGRELRSAHSQIARSSGEWFSVLLEDAEVAHGLTGPEVDRALRLGRRLDAAARVIEQGGHVSQVLWELWHHTGWADRLEADALSDSDSSPAANRDIDAVRALFDLAARDTQLQGARSVRQLLEEVESYEIPADMAREADIGQLGVQLMTAHRAKGRRWPLVVVAQVQEGTWPATRRRGSVLDMDRLTRDGIAEPEPYSRLIDAERRSFLLACSRATDHLVVSAAQGHEGEGDQASRFLAELGVEPMVVHGRPCRPVTLPMLVAQLRRVALAADTTAGLRAAAATRLARLADERDGQGRPLARGADPAQWWGLEAITSAPDPVVDPDRPVSLHGSDLGALLDCPRNWFLSRQARGDAGRSSASSLGSVIHALVGHAEHDDLSPDDLHDHLDEIWDRLSFEAQWLSVSEKAEADQALERYLGWAEKNGRTLVGTEVRFDVEVDAGGDRVRLSGSVDRLELDEHGRWHIVDFKTGRRAPTAASVTTDAQLGVYQLAAANGAFERFETGAQEVGGAELVYLRVGSDEFPTVLSQEPLHRVPWPTMVKPVPGEPTWMHAALGRAAEVVRSESFVAQACSRCRFCPFTGSCPVVIENPQVAR